MSKTSGRAQQDDTSTSLAFGLRELVSLQATIDPLLCRQQGVRRELRIVNFSISINVVVAKFR